MKYLVAAAVSIVFFAVTADGTSTRANASSGSKSPCIKNVEPMANVAMEIGRGALAWHQLRTRKETPCEFISPGAKLTRVILIVFHIALGIIAVILFCKEQMNIFNEREIIRATKALSKESSMTSSTRSRVTLNEEKQKRETVDAMRLARQLYRLRDGLTSKERREKNRDAIEKTLENLNIGKFSSQENAKETESAPQPADAYASTKKSPERSTKSYSQSSEDDSKSKTTSKSGTESSENEINKDCSRRSSAGHECGAERENFETKTKRRLAWDEVEMRRHGLVTRDCTHLAPPAETPPSVVVSEYSRFGNDLHSVSIDLSSLEDSISTARNATSSSTTFHDDWAVDIPQ